MTQTNVNTGGATQAGYGRNSATGAVNLRAAHSMVIRVRHTSTATNYDSVVLGYSINSGGNDSGSFISRLNADPATQLAWYRYSGTALSGTVRISGAYGDTTTWHHLAFVYDTTNITPYLDGVAGTPTASATTAVTSTTTCRIWCGGPHPGEFADAAFFGRALTAAEVLDLANMRNPDWLARGDCFAFCPEFADAVTLDLSGNGNTLSVINSGTGTSPTATNGAPPDPWYSRQPYVFLSNSKALATTGTTNTTGAAVATKSASAAASGTTQVTGTANVTQVIQITATGATQTTGAAVGANQLESPESYAIDNSHTWAAWVYPTSSQTSDILKAYAEDGSDSNPQGVAISGTTVTFYATNTTGTPATYSFSQALAQNAWSHVALVYDSVAHTCTSYVNGVSVNSAAYNGSAGAGPRARVGFMNNIVGTQRDVLVVESVLGPVDFAHIMHERVANALYVALAGGIVSGVFAPIWSPFPSGYYRWANPNGSSQLVFRGVPVFGKEAPPAAWTGSSPLVFRTVPAVSITATGSTQTTGVATLTSSAALVASGTTNTSGAAVATETQQFQITGSGLTNTTGASAVTAAAPLVAAGSVTTSGAAAATKAAGLVAAGSVQVTGSAAGAESAALVASGLTQVSGLASPSGALLAVGTTNTTGAAVVTLTQTFQITGAGLTNVSGVAALAITYPQAAAGSTQVTGAATLSPGPVGGGVAGNQTGGERRWSDVGGMRRKTRR